ncbi:MAG: death-on-curing protein [Paludibacter sp.]|nr:death-on-curing protein [Paludibacter sp.]
MSNIVIYKLSENQTEIKVQFDNDTVWLSQKLMAELFDKDSDTIGFHLKNIYSETELIESSTSEFFSVVQKEGNRNIRRKLKYYNLDAILSVGYRVNSKRGTQFRQWATQRLKEYLVQGYVINEERLKEKQLEVEYLKTGIRILGRAIEQQAVTEDIDMLKIFTAGLDLLDDYDHQNLDSKGNTIINCKYPSPDEYLNLITSMTSDFKSDVFALPKDESFDSSIHQIQQSFDGKDLYPSIEEKAAILLYLIVKNHSFVDGNKRIGAACLLLFLNKNDVLFCNQNIPIISNEALAALTLFVAISKTEEMQVIVRLIISILNRRK